MSEKQDVMPLGSVAAPASFVGGPVTVSILDDDSKVCMLAP